MDTFTIVRPEHLNHHGYLFGGRLLQWVDEFAWIVAARNFAGHRLVTRAMDRVEFTTQVHNGSILRFNILPLRQGNTSVTYTVNVYADALQAMVEIHVFSTNVTLVSVDRQGKKQKLPQKPELFSRVDAD